jgi:hypothetical protein
MVVNWYSRSSEESFDRLACVLRALFQAEVYEVGDVYAVFMDYPAREIWCTKTAVRNHLTVLDHIRRLPNEGGSIREWTRDGYIIAIDFYCDFQNMMTKQRPIVRREVIVV